MTSVLYGNYTDFEYLAQFVSERTADLNQLLTQLADPAFDDATRQKFGLNMNEFLLQNKFNQISNQSDYFRTFYDATHGNCIVFNSGVRQDGSKIDVLYQGKSGPANALQTIHFVDVYANQSYNYMNLFNSNTFGIKISIDDQDAIPLYRNNLIPVMPGACTHIGLRKTISTNLPKPYSGCTDLTNYRSVVYEKFVKWGKQYTQKVCFEICQQMIVNQTCGCAVIDYPNLENFKTCNYTFAKQCLAVGMNYTNCGDFCPLECEVTFYSYTVAQEYFPDRNYVDVNRANPQLKALFARANMAIENVTIDDMSKSSACLYVYFEDLRTTRIDESPAMSVVSIFVKFKRFIYSGCIK
jgi:hypothetical protein